MHTTGLVLAIFGGLLFFGSAFALACVNRDERSSAADVLDGFLLGGAIGLLRGLVWGIAEGTRNRSSPCFPACVLLGVSAVLLVTGFLLMAAGGS